MVTYSSPPAALKTFFAFQTSFCRATGQRSPAANAPQTDAGVSANIANRPSTIVRPIVSARVLGSELNKTAIPDSAAVSATSREYQPPGTEAVVIALLTISLRTARL